MASPLAHLNSSMLHGSPLLGSGCPTVLVMNQPAWRVGDQHSCMLVNSPPPTGVGGPHVSGFTMPPGSPTVFIGGMPAAAALKDKVQEPGAIPPALPPINNILSGAPTVLIG